MGDPRDGPRHPYIGDDATEPYMRPSVNAVINKLNRMNLMQDPMNRLEVVQRLSIDLPPSQLMSLIYYSMLGLRSQMARIPLWKPSILSRNAWETVFAARWNEVKHEFDALPSRRTPGKKINQCRVCGERREYIYHDMSLTLEPQGEE